MLSKRITPNWVLQRFLYTSQSLSDKDKGRLQKEILDTIFAESKIVIHDSNSDVKHSCTHYHCSKYLMCLHNRLT